MAKSNLFRSNRTQAVRIPKHLAFPEHVKSVEIVEIGQSRLISPAGGSWDSYFDGTHVSEDFMSERVQPPQRRGKL